MKNQIVTATFKELGIYAQIVYATNAFLILLGSGGVGKTASAKSVIAPALAKLFGIKDIEVIKSNFSNASPLEITGYGALKKGDNGEDLMVFAEPRGIPTVGNLSRTGNGDTDRAVLWVLDEFANWPADCQSLVRSAIDPDGEAYIGQHKLGKNVKILITSNRRTDGSRSSTADAPIISRANTCVLTADLQSWLEWAEPQEWGCSPVITYLKFNAKLEDLSHFAPDVPQPWDGTPHPNPRSWERAARQAEIVMADEETDIVEKNRLLDFVLRSSVGEVAGRDCLSFLKGSLNLLDDLEEIRKGDKKLPSKPIKQFQLLGAALRIAKAEVAGREKVAVHAGDLDWLVDHFLLAAEAEYGRTSVVAASRAGIPLDQHPKGTTLLGL